MIAAERLHAAIDEFSSEGKGIITRRRDAVVCEVGSAASPMFLSSDVMSGIGRHLFVDLSGEDLRRLPDDERIVKIEGDFCSFDTTEYVGRVDVICSKFLLEHLPDGELFHRRCFDLLKPGGECVHFFPTLYAPAFVVNKLVPYRLSRSILRFLYGEPADGKDPNPYPAYYSHCRGPTRRATKFFEGLGYEVVQYRGYYGTHYLERFPLANRVAGAVTSAIEAIHAASLTSYAYVHLRKPSIGR